MENISFDEAVKKLNAGDGSHTVGSLFKLLRQVSGKVLNSKTLHADATYLFLGGFYLVILPKMIHI